MTDAGHHLWVYLMPLPPVWRFWVHKGIEIERETWAPLGKITAAFAAGAVAGLRKGVSQPHKVMGWGPPGGAQGFMAPSGPEGNPGGEMALGDRSLPIPEETREWLCRKNWEERSASRRAGLMVVKEPLVTDKQEVLLPNTRQTRRQSPHTNGGTEAGRSSPRGKQQKPPGWSTLPQPAHTQPQSEPGLWKPGKVHSLPGHPFFQPWNAGDETQLPGRL